MIRLRYLSIQLTTTVETDMIKGVDGEDYKVFKGAKLTIPYLNARVFLARNGPNWRVNGDY